MALMQLSMHQLLSLPQITGVSLQHLVSMPTPAGLLCSCTFTRSKDLIPLEQEVLCETLSSVMGPLPCSSRGVKRFTFLLPQGFCMMLQQTRHDADAEHSMMQHA